LLERRRLAWLVLLAWMLLGLVLLVWLEQLEQLVLVFAR
jgi:hypothetical protein